MKSDSLQMCVLCVPRGYLSQSDTPAHLYQALALRPYRYTIIVLNLVKLGDMLRNIHKLAFLFKRVPSPSTLLNVSMAL